MGAAKGKRPRKAGVFVQECSDTGLGGGAGVFPRHAADFRSRDADVGEFTVTEARELAHTLIVAPPRPNKADKTRDEHGAFLSICVAGKPTTPIDIGGTRPYLHASMLRRSYAQIAWLTDQRSSPNCTA